MTKVITYTIDKNAIGVHFDWMDPEKIGDAHLVYRLLDLDPIRTPEEEIANSEIWISIRQILKETYNYTDEQLNRIPLSNRGNNLEINGYYPTSGKVVISVRNVPDDIEDGAENK